MSNEEKDFALLPTILEKIYEDHKDFKSIEYNRAFLDCIKLAKIHYTRHYSPDYKVNVGLKAEDKKSDGLRKEIAKMAKARDIRMEELLKLKEEVAVLRATIQTYESNIFKVKENGN